MSDNGKTFKGAAKEINAVFTHPDVTKYLDGLGVKWISTSLEHHGGEAYSREWCDPQNGV